MIKLDSNKVINNRMQKLIVLQYFLSNIIKRTFFNISFRNSQPKTYKLKTGSSNYYISTQKNIFLQISHSQKFFYSTKRTHPTNSIRMQPQLKSIASIKQRQDIQSQQKFSDVLAQDYPFFAYDYQLIDQVAKQSKNNDDSEQHKLRSEKRKQKLQKIRAELKDPEYRRQRNRQRHKRQKQKLQKNLVGLAEQQIKAFLVQRKKQKLQMKQKVKQAVQKQIGQPFLIDIAFQNQMNQKENKSLAIQIQLIVKTLKQIDPPPNLHLCGLREGITKAQLVSNRFDVWPIKYYEQPLQECLNMQKFKNKKVYYLSPDATKTLDTIDPDSLFIIGGLVDRTVIKNASLYRAKTLKIEARSLPIRPFMKQRSCLNLDHIVKIMCKFMQVNDWKVAFDYGAPQRWKCRQGQKGLKELKSEQDQDVSD